MNITFAPADEYFINQAVEKGYYSNATEVVRDAVRRLRERYAILYPEIMQDYKPADNS